METKWIPKDSSGYLRGSYRRGTIIYHHIPSGRALWHILSVTGNVFGIGETLPDKLVLPYGRSLP